MIRKDSALVWRSFSPLFGVSIYLHSCSSNKHIYSYIHSEVLPVYASSLRFEEIWYYSGKLDITLPLYYHTDIQLQFDHLDLRLAFLSPSLQENIDETTEVSVELPVGSPRVTFIPLPLPSSPLPSSSVLWCSTGVLSGSVWLTSEHFEIFMQKPRYQWVHGGFSGSHGIAGVGSRVGEWVCLKWNGVWKV